MLGWRVLSLVLLAWVQACGQAASAPPQPWDSKLPTPPAWPACAPVINSPAHFPENIAPGFPQPPALLLTKSLILHQAADNVELVGYVPLALSEAARWLQERLPEAGYSAVQTDAEADEVEGTIGGRGWSGNYWVKPEMTCTSVTEWVLIFRKS